MSELSAIVKGLKDVSISVNAMELKLVDVNAQYRATAGIVEKMTYKLGKVAEAVIRLEGKSKGFRADVMRLENFMRDQIHEIKKEDIPLIVCNEVADSLKEHEHNYIHKQKGAPNSSSPTSPQSLNTLTIPKWLVYIGIVLGVAIVGAGATLSKYVF